MKAKELKVLRKKIEKADRLPDPLPSLADGCYEAYKLGADEGGPSSSTASSYRMEPIETSSTNNLRLSWVNSWRDTPVPFEELVKLFEMNMGEMYQKSAWGLNLQEKKDELQHRKARLLIVTSTPAEPANKDSNDPAPEKIVAFCHYRFDFDDDQYPTCIALYLFEIQVAAAYQDAKIGSSLMALLHSIAQQAAMPKVMLTVFKANTKAMGFYTKKLQYEIDPISPSANDHYADYEILSQRVEPTT